MYYDFFTVIKSVIILTFPIEYIRLKDLKGYYAIITLYTLYYLYYIFL